MVYAHDTEEALIAAAWLVNSALPPESLASPDDLAGFLDESGLELDQLERVEAEVISLALLEDYDDLKDIRHNLAGKVRSMDMVLAEQQRATNKLQDGLISSQMVPFAGIVPRLRRLTQQVSAELKKQVSIRFSTKNRFRIRRLKIEASLRRWRR